MRVTRTTPPYEQGPYNSIFEAYRDFLDVIFQPRLPHSKETYVPMKDAETAIIDYASSGAIGVGLISGMIGVGKTSVINHLCEEVWKPQSCLVVSRDYSDVSFAPKLQSDYYTLEHAAQRFRATNIAHLLINELLKGEVFRRDNESNPDEDSWYDRVVMANPAPVRHFIIENYPHKVPSCALSRNLTDTEFLHALSKEDFDTHLRILFVYKLKVDNIDHVKIVLDNLDDKDLVLVACMVEHLAHLGVFIEKFSARERKFRTDAPIRRLTPLVCCRPATADAIQNDLKTRNGGGWYACREIHVPLPCSLSTALGMRVRHFFANAAKHRFRIIVGGHEWTVVERETFLKGLIEAFQESQQEGELVALCNFNLADCMKATMDVLKNVHFCQTDQLVRRYYDKNVQPTRTDFRELFTPTTVIRALAYGNQGKVPQPVYPIGGTRIVNVINSKHARLGESTLKIRLINLFSRLATTSHMSPECIYISLAQINEWGKQFFALSPEVTTALIDEMYTEGLLGNCRTFLMPSKVGELCTLNVTPRGLLLWRHLGQNSVLLECYRDEVELCDELKFKGRSPSWKDIATLESNWEDRLIEIGWMVTQMWLGERKETDNIVSRGSFSAFKSVFGPTLMSRHVKNGVDSSRRRFYSDKIRDQAALADFDRMMAALDADMIKSQDTWNAGRQANPLM
ncbi:MAG: hypothetical protein ACJ8C4_07065 [Gemmataceae bacterium]